MNTLENTIQTDLVQAMKNHQENTVSALRSVKTAIMEVKTAPGGKKDLEVYFKHLVLPTGIEPVFKV